MKTIYLNIKALTKKNQITDLCSKLGIETKTILPSDLTKTILCITKGSVPGMPEKLPVKVPIMYDMPELIIFSGFEEQDVQAFLKEFKNHNIERVPLKCVVTPYNLCWSLYDLIEHLKEEAKCNS